MATKKGHRIGIWIIAIALVIGTLGSFLAMMIEPQNVANDQARMEELTAQYEKEYADYQAKVDAQAKELSEKYYDEFKKYSDRPAVFDASKVTELKTTDLKVGDGQEIKADTAYSAYYIGWNPKGVVFDQSIDGDKLKAPLPGGELIEGWNEGVIGMKEGGVREITIPSEKAYGEAGSGENIPANTPIKFVVMIIPQVETIAAPQPSEELMQYYGN